MIYLIINEPQYDYDVRTMLMAFFRGEKIVTEPEGTDKTLMVRFTVKNGTSTRMYAEFTDRENKTVAGGSFCPGTVRQEVSLTVKKLLYSLLSRYTGRELPWGVLTGIRPTKLAREQIIAGSTRDEVIKNLQERYLVSEEKAGLCFDVAQQEEKILSNLDYEHTWSLYAGVPFCPSICAYCSFSSFPIETWKDQVDAYLDAFEKEAAAAAHLCEGHPLLTVYVGGGTPTSLNAGQLDRYMTALENSFDFSHVREITVEAGRPDSITMDKLEVLKKHGVTRISVNPQTMNQETLDLIGRRHTAEDVVRAFEMARKAGFDDINMDIIVGLPGERSEHVQKTMQALGQLGPDSLTVHCLALKRAAFLNRNREKFPVADTDEVNRMIRICREGAAQLGFKPYYLYRQKSIAGNLENTGYAREGCAGLYNMLIMEEVQTIMAIGSGASSKFILDSSGGGPRIERVENVKSVKDYIERIDEMIKRKKSFCNTHGYLLV